MSDTNTPCNPSNALVIFMTEDTEILLAIVPTDSELAVRAKRFHELTVSTGLDAIDDYDDYGFVANWFFDSENKKEVCPTGELSASLQGIEAIYKVGC